ncbi:MAG: hypothetical protein JWN78_238 [Bacteroidota bacterium]|nr:hypothetical protein [Bacteroidota bacterium]
MYFHAWCFFAISSAKKSLKTFFKDFLFVHIPNLDEYIVFSLHVGPVNNTKFIMDMDTRCSCLISCPVICFSALWQACQIVVGTNDI